MASGSYPDSGSISPASASAAGSMSAADFTKLLYDWRLVELAAANGLDSTLTRVAVSSDCCNLASDLTLNTAAGTGAINALQTVNGGAVEFASGATAASLRVASLGSSVGTVANGSLFAANTKTTHWMVSVRAKVITAPAGTGFLPICNMQDGVNENYLGIRPATSATNLVLAVAGAFTDTTIPFDITTWHTYRLRNTGALIKAYLDGVEIGSVANTSVSTSPGWSRTYASNGNQSANTNFYVNRWSLITSEP